MSKVRINDLARELEVKSKAILDVLTEVGVTEKKTHSSSLEDHEADRVRAKLRASGESQTTSKAAPRPGRAESDEIKTKIDLSNISKPGDVLKAIISKQAPAAPVVPPRPAAPPADAKPAAPADAPAAKARIAAPPKPVEMPAPRMIVPQTGVRPTHVVPAPPAAQTPVATPPRPPVAPPPVAAPPPTPPAAQTPIAARPATPIAPRVPPPRMIVPQTGPRPVY